MAHRIYAAAGMVPKFLLLLFMVQATIGNGRLQLRRLEVPTLTGPGTEDDSWTCYVLRVTQSFVNAKGATEFKYDIDGNRHMRKCFDTYYQRHQMGFPNLITMTMPTSTRQHDMRLRRICRDGSIQTFRLIRQSGRKAIFRSRVIPEGCRGPSFGSLYFRLGPNRPAEKETGIRAAFPKAKVQLSSDPNRTKLRAWQCSLVTASAIQGDEDRLTFKFGIKEDSQTTDCTSKYMRKYTEGFLQHLAVVLDDDFLRSLQLDKEEIQELVIETFGEGARTYLQSDSKSAYHLLDISTNSAALEAVHITLSGPAIKSKWEKANQLDIPEAWKTPSLQLLFKI